MVSDCPAASPCPRFGCHAGAGGVSSVTGATRGPVAGHRRRPDGRYAGLEAQHGVRAGDSFPRIVARRLGSGGTRAAGTARDGRTWISVGFHARSRPDSSARTSASDEPDAGNVGSLHAHGNGSRPFVRTRPHRAFELAHMVVGAVPADLFHGCHGGIDVGVA